MVSLRGKERKRTAGVITPKLLCSYPLLAKQNLHPRRAIEEKRREEDKKEALFLLFTSFFFY